MPHDSAVTRKKPGALGRVLLIGGLLMAAALVVHLTPIRAWLADAERVRATLTSLGLWVYPVSTFAVAILVACGIPRLLLCAAGGAAFGFWIGLLIVQAGTLLGHYVVFLCIRWAGRDWVLRKWPKLRKWAEIIHEQGIVGVFLVRQLPGHAMLANTCLGLSHVRHHHFLVGTLIGLLPEAIPATLIGAGLVKNSLMDSAGYLALAGAAVAVIWIGCGYVLRQMKNNHSISEVENINE